MGRHIHARWGRWCGEYGVHRPMGASNYYADAEPPQKRSNGRGSGPGGRNAASFVAGARAPWRCKAPTTHRLARHCHRTAASARPWIRFAASCAAAAERHRAATFRQAGGCESFGTLRPGTLLPERPANRCKPLVQAVARQIQVDCQGGPLHLSTHSRPAALPPLCPQLRARRLSRLTRPAAPISQAQQQGDEPRSTRKVTARDVNKLRRVSCRASQRAPGWCTPVQAAQASGDRP